MYNYLTKLTYRDFENDEIYREELLKCFNLDEYTDNINSEIQKLYEIVKEHYPSIIESLKKIKNLPFLILQTIFYTLLFYFLGIIFLKIMNLLKAF